MQVGRLASICACWLDQGCASAKPVSSDGQQPHGTCLYPVAATTPLTARECQQTLIITGTGMSTGPGDQALQPQTSGALLSSVGPAQVSEGPTATAQQSHSEQLLPIGCTVTCCLNWLRSMTLRCAVQQIL